MRRVGARWRNRWRRLAEQRKTWREQWAVEREIEDAVSGDGPIVAGPWLSEVGYEVLYWVPFLRWVQAAYRVRPERIIAISRGGVASWYRGVANRYLEAFDHIAPVDLAARAAAGEIKQRTPSAFDRDLLERLGRDADLAAARILHPSLMFRWFAPFWSGHETLGFVESHTRYAGFGAPEGPPRLSLPPEYAVVKFYSARSLPDGPGVRAQLQALVTALAERIPVVQLDTGLGVDEHDDYHLRVEGRVISVAGHLDARTNLDEQTRMIAGARLYVGTCGSLAWLAPLLGVDTVPVFTDDSFLHAHLQVARRAFGRLNAARFAPIDLSGLIESGLVIGSGDRLPISTPIS